MLPLPPTTSRRIEPTDPWSMHQPSKSPHTNLCCVHVRTLPGPRCCTGLGDEDDASADLVATSSYLDMLTDSRRNIAYNHALKRALLSAPRTGSVAAPPLQQRASQQPPSTGASAEAAAGGAEGAGPSPLHIPHVLDIGTGTGLLALLAAQAMGHRPEPAPAPASGGNAAPVPAPAPEPAAAGQAGAHHHQAITACEVFPPMQNLARRVIAHNGLAHAIKVVNKRSDELLVAATAAPATAAAATPAEAAAAGAATATEAPATAASARRAQLQQKQKQQPDMDARADVIVTEIFDSELLGEGMIPTMRHAVAHLLKVGCTLAAQVLVVAMGLGGSAAGDRMQRGIGPGQGLDKGADVDT